jgi:hypothetical protein
MTQRTTKDCQLGTEVSGSGAGGQPVAAQEVDKGKAGDQAPQEDRRDAPDPQGDEGCGEDGPEPGSALGVALLHFRTHRLATAVS